MRLKPQGRQESHTSGAEGGTNEPSAIAGKWPRSLHAQQRGLEKAEPSSSIVEIPQDTQSMEKQTVMCGLFFFFF